MKITKIRPLIIASALALPAIGAIGLAPDAAQASNNGANGVGNSPAPVAPEEYDHFIVFVANGVYPETEPQGLFDDLSAFTDVNGMTLQEIEDWKDDKLSLLADINGIVDPENDPNLGVFIGTTNPAIDYHVAFFSGRKVPPSGWQVREAFLTVVVTNPAGYTLGGEFAGVHVPAGTIVGGGGIYNIEVTDKFGDPTGEEVVIDFTTVQPVEPVTGGRAAFFCDVENDELGVGLAQGVNALVPIGGGMVQANVRNVFTFNEDGGL